VSLGSVLANARNRNYGRQTGPAEGQALRDVVVLVDMQQEYRRSHRSS
jgi:hypothetical protein